MSDGNQIKIPFQPSFSNDFDMSSIETRINAHSLELMCEMAFSREINLLSKDAES